MTLLVLWLYMPETRGRSLESIQEVFHPPVRDLRSRLWSSRRLRHRPADRAAAVDRGFGLTAVEMKRASGYGHGFQGVGLAGMDAAFRRRKQRPVHE